MPLSITCDCGKSLRVKEEFAGKKVRCPGCREVLKVPEPEVSVEEDALTAWMSEEPTASPPPKVDTRFQEEETPRIPPKPSSKPKSMSVDDETSKPRKKRLNPMPREDRERLTRPTGPGIVINGSIVTGCLMMLGAVIWFFGALALGRIFFYPPILFIMGIAAVYRGFTGQDE